MLSSFVQHYPSLGVADTKVRTDISVKSLLMYFVIVQFWKEMNCEL